jgi:hypothetical protein
VRSAFIDLSGALVGTFEPCFDGLGKPYLSGWLREEDLIRAEARTRKGRRELVRAEIAGFAEMKVAAKLP